MALTIDIPADAEDALRAEWGGNLEQAAKEALLIESYRSGKISIGFLAGLLDMTRWDTESWLGSRGVHWNYGADELEVDLRTLSELRGDRDSVIVDSIQ